MFRSNLMWRFCHLASTWKSSLKGSISTCVWCGNCMWRGWSTWKPPGNRVSNTWFLVGLLQNLTHSVSNAYLLSLTLSFSHRPHTYQSRLSLTLSLSHSSTHSHASLSHPLHPHIDTLSPSLHSHSPSPLSLSLHYFTFISFAKRIEIVSNAHHRALSSFSLRSL